MLKRLRKCWACAALIALCMAYGAIRIGAALSLQPPHPINQPEQQAESQPGGESNQNVTPWEDAGAWEAFFTALIAIYAIRAFVEGRKSSQRELRAYISVNPSTAFMEGNRFGVVVKMENTGNTPAFETQCLWMLNVGPKPDRGNIELTFANPNNDPIPTFVLYPNSGHSSVRTIVITPEEMAAINAGTAVIRAFGRAVYIDAFKVKQWGEFYSYMDKHGYQTFLFNFNKQPLTDRRPVEAPFKFKEGNNRASFS